MKTVNSVRQRFAAGKSFAVTAASALLVPALVALNSGAALSAGGTAKPPAPKAPPGACPIAGTAAIGACILPPAGPVLPNFPAAGGALSGNASNGFSVTGIVQSATGPACRAGGAGPGGGTVTVNGIVITIPSDTIVQYPANTLTWGDALCGIAPLATDLTGGTGPVIYPGVEISVDGNIAAAPGAAAGIGSPHIGSIVRISQQSLNSGHGYISFIDYADGSIYVSTTGGELRLLINDPKGRYGRAQSSVDARFSVDDANPTIKSGASGYPMCVPRQDPAVSDDPRCPQKNRPTAAPCRNFGAASTAFRIAGADMPAAPINGFCAGFVMKALAGMPGTFNLPATSLANGTTDPDPRQMAPFEIGDFITWQGTLVLNGNVTLPPANRATTTNNLVWVHSIDANVGVFTQPGTLPAYIAIGANGIGVDPQPALATALVGVEATPRLVVEANTTDVASIVDFYLDDKGFSLPAATPAGPLVADAPGAPPNEYFRWMTPEIMTGTLANQATQAAKGVVVPASSVAQANAFGGGIYTQFIGPQPGRARIRAIKTPAIDATQACPATGPTIGGTQGCAITQSPTRYLRAVLRSLCAPAASGVSSSVAGFPAVPATNLGLDAATSPNKGPYFGINGARPNLPSAGNAALGFDGGPGPGNVPSSDGTCLQSAQYANGLFTGQYMAPVSEFIFPENKLTGNPVVPNNLWHMGFLAYGENGRDGNSTAPQAPRPW
jgi:hypothetical protein